MCVDPRRLARAAAALALSPLVVITLACGNPQPRQQAAPLEAGPTVLGPAERAAWYQACWGHFNTRAWDALRACYADGAESDQVNSGRPVASGIDALMAASQAFTSAFPDVKGTGELVIVKGDEIVSVYVLNGTHSGPLAGPGGQAVPATGKAIGYRQAHLVRTNESGSKVVKEEFYADSATLFAQLGLSAVPARPVATSALAAPVVVVADGTPAELSNVESLRTQMAAYNSHDANGVAAFSAQDFVYHDMATPADQNAKEALASTQAFLTAFPDARLTPDRAWGAGRYVVVTGRFEGTNKGPMPGMGIKKPTGKAVSARYLDITRWEGGKIKEEWLFYDGLAMAGQLGLGKK